MADSIGERIKGLRSEQGLTLAELGEKTDLSTSYLSQVERGKTLPSLTTLAAIARVFNVGLRYFFEEESELVYIVRAADRLPLPPSPTLPAPTKVGGRQSLMPVDANTKIEIYRIDFQAQSAEEELSPYYGEETIFILSGELLVWVGDERYTLTAGDSIHYDAIQPHGWCNEEPAACSILWGRAASLSE